MKSYALEVTNPRTPSLKENPFHPASWRKLRRSVAIFFLIPARVLSSLSLPW